MKFIAQPAILLAAALTSFLLPCTLRAGGHSDAPALAHDAGANIGDLFAFLDPNDNSQVVVIGTFHPFIMPGEATSAAVFDPNVRYRFEIYNDHVNLASPVLSAAPVASQLNAYLAHLKPNRNIDITFSKRAVGTAPQSNAANGNPIPVNLRRPLPQVATVTLRRLRWRTRPWNLSGSPGLAFQHWPGRLSFAGLRDLRGHHARHSDPRFCRRGG